MKSESFWLKEGITFIFSMCLQPVVTQHSWDDLERKATCSALYTSLLFPVYCLLTTITCKWNPTRKWDWVIENKISKNLYKNVQATIILSQCQDTNCKEKTLGKSWKWRCLVPLVWIQRYVKTDIPPLQGLGKGGNFSVKKKKILQIHKYE